MPPMPCQIYGETDHKTKYRPNAKEGGSSRGAVSAFLGAESKHQKISLCMVNTEILTRFPKTLKSGL